MTIEEYLEQVGRGRNSSFGRQYRSQFRDRRGTAELGMLAAPSEEEFTDFCSAVSVMTEKEKSQVKSLTDEQRAGIAERCGGNSGNIGIFFNGYVLAGRETAETEK